MRIFTYILVLNNKPKERSVLKFFEKRFRTVDFLKTRLMTRRKTASLSIMRRDMISVEKLVSQESVKK